MPPNNILHGTFHTTDTLEVERWNNILGRWQSRKAFAVYELNRVRALKTKIITPPAEEQQEVTTKKQSFTLGNVVSDEKNLIVGNMYAVSQKDLHTFPLVGATHQIRSEPITGCCTIVFKRLVKNADGDFRSLIGPSYESVSIRSSAQIMEVKVASNS